MTEPLTPAQARRIADLISQAPLDSEGDRAHLAVEFATAMPETPWLDLISIVAEGGPTVREWAAQTWDPAEEWFAVDPYAPIKDLILELIAAEARRTSAGGHVTS